MPVGPFAIVVSVPGQENHCFLATPFAPAFRLVSDVVVRAANRLGLRTIRTDEIQMTDSFPRDIVLRTRAARVVVAVCSPDPGTGVPNPNVMYEAGLAHALGKPTVLMTSSAPSLPADLRVSYVVEYQDDQLHDPGYTENLMLTILQAIQDRLAVTGSQHQPGAAEIAIAYSRHKMLLAPEFWDDFRTVLSFAKRIHDQIQAIDSVHLDALRRHIDDIVFRSGAKAQKIGSFNSAWRDYSNFYQTFTLPNVFSPLDRTLSSTEDSFNRMPADADDPTRQAVQKARGFYNDLRDDLRNYPILHEAVVKTTGENFVSLLENKETARQIHFHIQTLSSTSRRCILSADRLIVNLIDIML